MFYVFQGKAQYLKCVPANNKMYCSPYPSALCQSLLLNTMIILVILFNSSRCYFLYRHRFFISHYQGEKFRFRRLYIIILYKVIRLGSAPLSLLTNRGAVWRNVWFSITFHPRKTGFWRRILMKKKYSSFFLCVICTGFKSNFLHFFYSQTNMNNTVLHIKMLYSHF